MKKVFTKIETYIAAFVVIVAILAGVWNLSFAKARPADYHGFSAHRAIKHINAIAAEPSSVFNQPQLEQTRQYITDTLNLFGVNNHRVSHNPRLVWNRKTETQYIIPVDNIYASISGASGVYILLTAHFDSNPCYVTWPKPSTPAGAGESFGAADNGYGVATLLELAAVLSQSSTPLINGVKFAFLDAEEVGLMGAQALVNEYSEWLENVNFVINVDARGMRAPVFMYETSTNNSRVIQFFANAGRPFAFSIAAEIYRILPVGSDFTVFLEAGFKGVNLAVLNGLRYYHTEYDRIENICINTLQAYGNTILPLLREFTSNPKYGDMDFFYSDRDSVFFTILPNVFVHYTTTTSWIIIAITMVFFVLLAIVLTLKKKITMSKALKSALLWLAFIVVCAGAGYLISQILGLAFGVSFDMIFMLVPFDFGFLIIAAILICALSFAVLKLKKKLKINTDETLFGGLMLNVILTFAAAFALHGGTFIWLFPSIFTIAALFVKLVEKEKVSKIISLFLNSFLVIFTIILTITIVVSLFWAVTIGSLMILLIFLGIALTVIMPSICKIYNLNFSEGRKDIK